MCGSRSALLYGCIHREKVIIKTIYAIFTEFWECIFISMGQAEVPFNLDDHEDPAWVPLGLGITLLPDGTVKMENIVDECVSNI